MTYLETSRELAQRHGAGKAAARGGAGFGSAFPLATAPAQERAEAKCYSSSYRYLLDALKVTRRPRKKCVSQGEAAKDDKPNATRLSEYLHSGHLILNLDAVVTKDHGQ